MMRKILLPILIAFVLVLSSFTPALAVTGGQPDNNGHPYGALLLVPGYTFCSGTLIDEDVILTAAHCTSFWEENDLTVYVSFDPYASVDPDTWEITGGTWYTADTFVTHPDYVDADWPYTADYGLVLLDEPVVGIAPALLPSPYLLDDLVGTTGQTEYRFMDVGYGVSGVDKFKGWPPYLSHVDFIRRVSIQRFNPSVNTQPYWFMLQNVPNAQFGGACGGDSGSGIFPVAEDPLGDTVVAVHTGGYRMGWEGQLCGRKTSLNHRVDLPFVLDWIALYID